MRKVNIYRSVYWMTSKRSNRDYYDIMLITIDGIIKKIINKSSILIAATEKVGLWPSLVVDLEVEAGVVRVSRLRRPPFWSVSVYVSFDELERASDSEVREIIVDGWKTAIGLCLAKLKVPQEESDRIVSRIEKVKTETWHRRLLL